MQTENNKITVTGELNNYHVTLKDEDFLVAAERVKFSYKLSLYYILINLPGYDKEKDRSVKEYARRKYGKQVSISSTTEVYY